MSDVREAQTPFRVVLGSDEAGMEYAEKLKEFLSLDVRVSSLIDVGVHRGAEDEHTPYPNVAIAAGELIAQGVADRGILICGTGMGVAIAANKVKGIRAVTAHDSYSVERSIKSNNAHILALGQRVIGIELAKKLVDEWLGYSFDRESNSAQKITALSEYEEGQ